MNDTMKNSKGVGLAAIQIGTALSVLIINLPVIDENDEDIQKDENLIEAINPKIIYQDGEQISNEGCLSVPAFTTDIKRAKTIKVKYQDRYGKELTMQADDYMAVAWQHEIEHLSGHVFIENLKFAERKKFEKLWKKKQKKKK